MPTYHNPLTIDPSTRTVTEGLAATLNEDALYAAVAFGWRVEVEIGSRYDAIRSTCWIAHRPGNSIVMRSGLTGTHELNADAWATTAERLHAHWQGFKVANVAEQLRAENRAMGYY